MASFFFDKKRSRMVAYKGSFSALLGNNARNAALIVREILGSKSGRRTEHLVAVDVNPVPMTRGKVFFVRGDDCSAPRGQTQNQTPIGCDSRDATPYRTSA